MKANMESCICIYSRQFSSSLFLYFFTQLGDDGDDGGFEEDVTNDVKDHRIQFNEQLAQVGHLSTTITAVNSSKQCFGIRSDLINLL